MTYRHPIYPLTPEGELRIRPVGRVSSAVKEEQTGGFTRRRCTIELESGLEPLLDGIEEFSHLLVVFWMAHVREHAVRRRPQGRDGVPVTGILATR
jgi:tRNA (Thr-GGU) A37 N-methylase